MQTLWLQQYFLEGYWKGKPSYMQNMREVFVSFQSILIATVLSVWSGYEYLKGALPEFRKGE